MMYKFDPNTTLLVVALESELPPALTTGWRVVYSGVGKINAAVALAEALTTHDVKNVINFGSAGSLRSYLFGIQEVTRFVQRDMDVRALGFALGQTPFEDDWMIDLGRPGLCCGTGDNFVSAAPELDSDLVDMEAFALAKICQDKLIDFYCFKFVSDNANDSAADDWSKRLAFGAQLFADNFLNGAGGEMLCSTYTHHL